MTTIGNIAFGKNYLKNVILGDSVTDIGARAFNKNETLESVVFTGEAPTVEMAFKPAPSFDYPNAGLTLTYPWRYRQDSAQRPYGYTSPSWRGGYKTQAAATVDFDLNGHGSTAPDDQQVIVDEETVPRPADLTEPGYVFTGWYTDPAATSAFDFSAKIDRDRTLYAGWEDGTVPGIAGDATVDGKIGAPFSYIPSITGAPAPMVSLTSGDLPDGLSLDANTGEITGTPTGEAGDYAIELTVGNGVEPDATLRVTISINPEDDPGSSEADDSVPGASGPASGGGQVSVSAGDPLPDTGGAPLGLLMFGLVAVVAGILLLRRRIS